MGSELTYSKVIDAKMEAEEYFRRRAKDELLWFTKYTKPNFRINWHHALTAKYLMKWIRGEIKYLIISEPPRHGKTELVNRRMVPFILGQDPDAQIIGASYAQSLASRINRDIQRVIDTERYRNVFPNTHIASKHNMYTSERRPLRNNDEFEIIGRLGSYRCAGIGGGITGTGCKYLIIDDPVKDHKQADSADARENAWEWLTITAFSRLEDDSRVLINMTRWHDDDVAGRLIQQRDSKGDHALPWVELRLPAIRDNFDNPEDPRQLGEALWPWKYDEARLAKIEATAGPRWWSAVYQQTPTPASGAFFKDTMFDIVPVPAMDEYEFTFIMADTAYKDKQQNDFTVFTMFGYKEGELYILDVWRQRIKAAEIEEAIIPWITGYQSYGFRGCYIEPKGHGIYLNQTLPKKQIVMPSETMIEEFYKDRHYDKIQRANNAIPFLGNRRVHINEKINQKTELLQEALRFPRAAHDDFVDTLIDGIKFVYASSYGILDVL